MNYKSNGSELKLNSKLMNSELKLNKNLVANLLQVMDDHSSEWNLWH